MVFGHRTQNILIIPHICINNTCARDILQNLRDGLVTDKYCYCDWTILTYDERLVYSYDARVLYRDTFNVTQSKGVRDW